MRAFVCKLVWKVLVTKSLLLIYYSKLTLGKWHFHLCLTNIFAEINEKLKNKIIQEDSSQEALFSLSKTILSRATVDWN